jgi:hypothetical protein
MENINLNHVVIFGYREKYYVNPNVTVYKNGMLIGMVAHLGRSQFKINEPCELAFNVRHQTITCKVNPGDQIQLSLNRWSGKLTAQLIENSNSHQEIIERNNQQDRKGVKKLVIFIVLMGIIVGACWIPSILDSSSSSSSSSYTSQYKSFRTAVDDGSIYPGMTYEQIAKICGESRYVSYSRGRVQFVYYGNYQLCFDNYGRYEYYNYSTY